MAWKGVWAEICLTDSLLAGHLGVFTRTVSKASGERSEISSLQCHSVLPSGDVGRELVAVMAPVTTYVTLERVTEAVAAHVDGEHHAIQKEHTAVVAPVHIKCLSLFVDHSNGVSGADGWGLEEFIGAWNLLQQGHSIAGSGRNHGVVLEQGVRAFFMVAIGVCGVLAAVIGRQATF